MIFAKLTKPAGEKAASQSRLVRRLIALTLFLWSGPGMAQQRAAEADRRRAGWNWCGKSLAPYYLASNSQPSGCSRFCAPLLGVQQHKARVFARNSGAVRVSFCLVTLFIFPNVLFLFASSSAHAQMVMNDASFAMSPKHFLFIAVFICFVIVFVVGVIGLFYFLPWTRKIQIIIDRCTVLDRPGAKSSKEDLMGSSLPVRYPAVAFKQNSFKDKTF